MPILNHVNKKALLDILVDIAIVPEAAVVLHDGIAAAGAAAAQVRCHRLIDAAHER